MWMTIEELEKEREIEDNFWKNFPTSRIGKLLHNIHKTLEDEDISNGEDGIRQIND